MELSSIRYTLCFLTRGDDVLMLHRQNPPNQGLWNGVGGHLEPGESPHSCVIREVYEETGYRLCAITFAGLLTWDGFETPPGGLFLFTAPAPAGEPLLCSEGELAWKPRAWVFSSPEVVSNIHIFAPLVFDGAPPQVYHFSYHNKDIQSSAVFPLPENLRHLLDIR